MLPKSDLFHYSMLSEQKYYKKLFLSCSLLSLVSSTSPSKNCLFSTIFFFVIFLSLYSCSLDLFVLFSPVRYINNNSNNNNNLYYNDVHGLFVKKIFYHMEKKVRNLERLCTLWGIACDVRSLHTNTHCTEKSAARSVRTTRLKRKKRHFLLFSLLFDCPFRLDLWIRSVLFLFCVHSYICLIIIILPMLDIFVWRYCCAFCPTLVKEETETV